MFNGQREIIIVSAVTQFNVGDISKSEILPDKYKSLLYSLYPNRKPKELITSRVSKPTNDIYGGLEDFPGVLEDFLPTVFDENIGVLKDFQSEKKTSLDYVMDDFEKPDVTFIVFNGRFVKDWYHFRGTVYYLHPWANSMNNTSLTNNYVFVSENRQGAFFHIAVKRKTSWTKHIERINKHIGTHISVTPPFAQFIESNEFLKYDVVVTFLLHEFSADTRHANAMIIDNVNRLVIRFEPHGYASNAYDIQQCDVNITNALKNFSPLRNYTYIAPAQYEQYQGPQTVERKQNAYIKIAAKIGSIERVFEAGGFCLAWSILFSQYYYNNSMYNFGYSDVYKHLDLTSNHLAALIRHFQGRLVNLSKEENGNKYLPPTAILNHQNMSKNTVN
jgi:hypothetical protein